MMRCVIFTAGEVGALRVEDLGLHGDEYIICCDGGYTLAMAMGVRPQLIVGDFDSYHGELPQDGTEVLRLCSDKDDTDTMVAVKRAIAAGAQEIVLVAATGSRLDHTIANLQTLLYIANRGISARIVGAQERVYALRNSFIELHGERGSTFSVFSLSDRAQSVSIKGADFPLDNVLLENSIPLGVSNRISDNRAVVSVEDGTLLVIVPNGDTI